MVSIKLITERVAEYYGLTIAQVKAKTRFEEVVNARRAAMTIAHRLGNSKSSIARAFDIDRSSVIYHINKMEEQATIYPYVEDTLTKLAA